MVVGVTAVFNLIINCYWPPGHIGVVGHRHEFVNGLLGVNPFGPDLLVRVGNI